MPPSYNQQPEQAPGRDPVGNGIEGVDLGRRRFLRWGAGAVATVGLGAVALTRRGREDVAQPVGDFLLDGSDYDPNSHGDAHATPGNPEEGHDEQEHGGENAAEAQEAVSHEAHEISNANWMTAVPVFGNFVRILKKNADPQDPYALGLDSFKSMVKVTGTRLGILRFMDKKAFDHEVKELIISYGLMTGLVTMAEATEHLEADEDAIYNGLKTVSDKADESLGVMQKPEEDAGKEQWQEYLTAKERSVATVASQNFALGGVYAPELSTYTTATLANVLVGRMSKQLYEMNLAKGMVARGDNEHYIDIALKALERTEGQINGEMGYMNLILTYAGNIQGAAGVGDPPNIFLAIRRKLGEWLEASALGATYANASALFANEMWLTRVGGISPRNLQGGFIKKSAVAAAKTLVSIPTSLTHAIKRDRSKRADALYEVLSNGDGFGENDVETARELINGIKRPGLSFDTDSFKSAFSHYFEGKEDIQAEDLAERLYNRYFDVESGHDYDPSADVEIDNALRFIDKSSKKPSDAIRAVAEEVGILVDNHETHALMDAFDFIAEKGTNDEDALNRLSHYNFGGIEEEEAARLHIEENIDRIAAKYETGERNEEELKQDLKDLFATHASVTGVVLPEKVQDALYELWAKKIKADTEVHAEHGGLSHAAKEVLAALSTQILAATSASVLAEKLLGTLGDAGLSISHQRKIVMGLTAGISAFADNVVAYVFGETVLINIHNKAYGGEIPKEMEKVLSQTAWILAIAGGAHSRIGNGPNFKMQKVRLSLDDQTHELIVSRDDNEFNDSLKNVWAFLNTTLLFEIGRQRINNVEEKYALAA